MRLGVMRLGFAAKVALGTVLPVVVGMGAFVLLTFGRVGTELRGRAEDQLLSEVRTLALSLDTVPNTVRIASIADALGVRITFIALDGSVLADSEGEPSRMENHGKRPEIVAARDGAPRVFNRTSRTVNRSLFYAASKLPGKRGYVRMARDVSSIDEELASIAQSFWLVAAALLVFGGLFAVLFARRMTRPVMELTRVAIARAEGDASARVTPVGVDEVARLGKAFNDMTDQLDQSIELAESEAARLTTVLGGMTEGVIAVDRHEAIVFLNDASRAILDIEGDARGAALFSCVREPRILGLVQRAARDGAPVEAEIRSEGPPRRLVQVYAAPAGTGVILVLRDISRMRRLESMRTDFVSNVSHELRTPLASIAAAVETLEDEATRSDPETADRFLSMMRRNVTRLEALLDDILALSRFESRPETILRVPVDFAQAARRAVEEHQDRALRAELTMDFAGVEKLMVNGDPETLQRILDNLIVNAINYTSAGGSIEVRTSADGEFAALRVRDTGVGISEADRERIFERFYRVDKGRSRTAGGTGLGLAIVKHAVAFHGGAVNVDSVPGRGSTFTVRLPIILG